MDLIVLDINMPGEDGLSVLRSLRPENTVPVVMLTAAGEVVDRIIGLEMGADDYLGKPVDLRELEARIKAVLRRKIDVNLTNDSAATPDSVKVGTHTLNIEAATLAAADSGTTLVGLDTGAFVLAFAGLMDGYETVVHYEHLDSFRELFPEIAVRETLYTIDRERMSCCGGVAAVAGWRVAIPSVRQVNVPVLASRRSMSPSRNLASGPP